MTRRILCAAAGIMCFFGISMTTLYAQTPPGQVDAYVRVIKAEQAEKNSDIKDAVKHYRAAIELYQEVQEQYPEWRPELVRYRIADSLNNVKRLERKIGVENKPIQKPKATEHIEPKPDTSAEITSLREKEAALQEQNQQLKLRTEKLENHIETLQADAEKNKAKEKEKTNDREVAKLKKEIERLTSANRDLTVENVAMGDQIIDLSAINKNLIKAAKDDEGQPAGKREIKRAVKEAVGPLEDEIESLRDERKALEKERKDLNKQLVDQQERALKEQEELLKPLERQVADLEKERAKLAERVDELKDGTRKDKKYRKIIDETEAENTELAVALSETTRQLEEAREKLDARSEGKSPELDALKKELDKLTGENEALKYTVDMNFDEMERIREYKKEIKTLKKTNKKLAGDMEDLQKKMEKNDLSADYARVVSQNNVLVDEVQSFRKRLDESEKQIRKLERERANITTD